MSTSSARHSESKTRFTLRVPEDLQEDIRLIADEQMRSVNAEVVVALKNHVRAYRNASRPPDNLQEAA